MEFKRLLITGGAGFVGSSLAILFKQAFFDVSVIALDNLKRRGSGLNLPRLKAHGIEFIHGDVRCAEDLEAVPEYDLLLDCSADPSVQAGLKQSPRGVIETNLIGAVNCLEAARQRGASLLFLSTSRVYSIAALNALSFTEDESRFRWNGSDIQPGFSSEGIRDTFSLEGPRSVYGATKLAAEHLLLEYVHHYEMKAIINRCGILAGPWQMGKMDQGIVTYWLASHVFKRPLTYMGFGGAGKQVRDVLHIEDFFDLIVRQMKTASHWHGQIYNVGGGEARSVSLQELTKLCQSITGCSIDIASEPATNKVDLRIYLTDIGKVSQVFGWSPTRGHEQIIADVHAWIDEHRQILKSILDP